MLSKGIRDLRFPGSCSHGIAPIIHDTFGAKLRIVDGTVREDKIQIFARKTARSKLSPVSKN
jgi:hypothetical protein